ncbi:MAG: 4Fe-4S dicluster domain-containing protein [Nitrospira sp.]|nr:4Fe-4S dicluster domain-containing protein [Nitrospira sp.]
MKHSNAPAKVSEVPVITERQDWLRPPGAVNESEFLDRCTKCDDCIDTCPFDAIRHHKIDETPVIIAEENPCRLCEDFPCIEACESEALLSLSGASDVRMGIARLSYQDCTAAHGCNACVSKCPEQAIAMDFGSMQLSVRDDRCVGCGICQQICKAVNDRVAIRVFPSRLLPP